jgi:CRISPR/Cas system-associated endonuclease/helicase Cas3
MSPPPSAPLTPQEGAREGGVLQADGNPVAGPADHLVWTQRYWTRQNRSAASSSIFTPPLGSGKTAAFLLPMLVHLMDQRELDKGEGPIGIVIAPTRELAQQIHVEAKKFARAYGVRLDFGDAR